MYIVSYNGVVQMRNPFNTIGKIFTANTMVKAALLDAAAIGLYKGTGVLPDIILSVIPLPLYQVQHYEVGRSQDVLKFRAVRGQFLAHQHGGNTAFRIDLTLTGPTKGLIINMIQGLQIYGEKYKPDITLNLNARNIIPKPSLLDIGDNSYLESAENRTFPVWTKFEIMFNMFIETFTYARTVVEGKDAIKATIMLRRFIKTATPAYTIESPVANVENRKGRKLLTGVGPKNVVYYRSTVPDNYASIEYGVAALSRFTMIGLTEGFSDINSLNGLIKDKPTDAGSETVDVPKTYIEPTDVVEVVTIKPINSSTIIRVPKIVDRISPITSMRYKYNAVQEQYYYYYICSKNTANSTVTTFNFLSKEITMMDKTVVYQDNKFMVYDIVVLATGRDTYILFKNINNIITVIGVQRDNVGTISGELQLRN